MLGRAKGWKAFRQLWIDLLQHPGYKHKRPLSPEEAERFVDQRGSQVDEAIRRAFERQQQRNARKQTTEQERIDRQVSKAIRLLRRALEYERSAMLKKVRERAHAMKRFKSDRKKWLHRKPARDMTMQDLRTEMPDNLKSYPGYGHGMSE